MSFNMYILLLVDKQDTEIESLTKRLEGLEKQHKTASATATKLREVSLLLFI